MSEINENEMYETEAVEEVQPFNLAQALYSVENSDLIALPSGKSASVREMTGNEQRNFMNRTSQLNGNAVQSLLAACIVTYNDAPIPKDPAERTAFLLDLLCGDRSTLVFHIRRHSLGSDFSFTAKCPECKKEASWEVDLNIKEDFPMKPYKYGDQRVVTYDSKLHEGLKIRFTHINGHDEMTVLRKRNNLTVLTDLELRKPHAYDAAKDIWVPIVLNKMTDKLITEMRHEIRATEGSTRTTVDVICQDCSQPVSFDLLQQPDFMTPSVTS